MEKKMAITAKKIAEKLNLSPSAVSLVLNGKPGVSDSTREKWQSKGHKKSQIPPIHPPFIPPMNTPLSTIYGYLSMDIH